LRQIKAQHTTGVQNAIMKKLLIAYFSRSGLTERASIDLHDFLLAHINEIQQQPITVAIEQIIPQKSPHGFLGYMLGRWQASIGDTQETIPPKHQARQYDAMVLAMPNWASGLCPAVRHWLAQQPAPLPPYACMITQSDSNPDSEARHVRAALATATRAQERGAIVLSDRCIAYHAHLATLAPFARRLPTLLDLTCTNIPTPSEPLRDVS
jgi:hypothetical protein